MYIRSQATAALGAGDHYQGAPLGVWACPASPSESWSESVFSLGKVTELDTLDMLTFKYRYEYRCRVCFNKEIF